MTAYHPFRSATAKEQYLKLYDRRAGKWLVVSETRIGKTWGSRLHSSLHVKNENPYTLRHFHLTNPQISFKKITP
jgi:hypothetical protein